MASQQEKKQLDERAKKGETVVPGGTGGKSLEAQQHLAEGAYLSLFLTHFFGYVRVKLYMCTTLMRLMFV